METTVTTENLAETLARELKSPAELAVVENTRLIAVPPGWKIERQDDERFLPAPRRKIASVILTDADSFVRYCKRHGSLTVATIWTEADFVKGALKFVAILNDHGEEEAEQNWRDHRATFMPEFSEEWKRWTGSNKSNFSQASFAAFLENNLKDIASGDGLPAGGDILKMAIDFESKEAMRFKSAIRLQSGGVRMEYVADEDKSTIEAMQVFERFQIAVPVFRDDTARYQLTARLRYRARDGKVEFWYELIRPDLVMEASSRAMVETVRTGAGLPFFFGTP